MNYSLKFLPYSFINHPLPINGWLSLKGSSYHINAATSNYILELCPSQAVECKCQMQLLVQKMAPCFNENFYQRGYKKLTRHVSIWNLSLFFVAFSFILKLWRKRYSADWWGKCIASNLVVMQGTNTLKRLVFFFYQIMLVIGFC